jgi:hypothetical protein
MDWAALGDFVIRVGSHFGLWVLGGGAVVYLVALFLKRPPWSRSDSD